MTIHELINSAIDQLNTAFLNSSSESNEISNDQYVELLSMLHECIATLAKSEAK